MNELVEQVYCFSESEFSVLADACGVRNLLCFNPENGRDTLIKPAQSAYLQVVFNLDKRGIISQENGNMYISDDVAKLISSCNRCKCILQIMRGEEDGLPVCINVMEDGEFVSFYPGKQKDEYVRISRHNSGELKTYLDEMNLFNANSHITVFQAKSMEKGAYLSGDQENLYDCLIKEMGVDAL